MRAAALALILALPAFAKDDLVDSKSPNGWWTLKVPGGWARSEGKDPRFKESFVFETAMAADSTFQLQILEVDVPLDALAAGVKSSYKERGLAIENEGELTLNGCPAIRYEFTVKGPKGKGHLLQVIVDGGGRKGMITVGLPDPAPEGAWAEVESVVATFTLEAMEAAPLEWKRRSLDSLGIELDLPVDGEPTEMGPREVQLRWQDKGLFFAVERKRTRAPYEELLAFDVGDVVKEGTPTPTILSKEEAVVDGRKGLLARIGADLKGKRVMTMTVLYFPAGEGEVVQVGIGKAGEQDEETGRRISDALVGVHASTSWLAPPAASTPALTAPAEAWDGAASLSLPAGWTPYTPRESKPHKGAPTPKARGGWAADHAADLGVYAEAGTFAGGQKAYEEWLRKDEAKSVSPPVFAASRAIDVGGRGGVLWEYEAGPASDRWVHKVVAVFDGDSYWLYRCAHPTSLKGVYGPLAEALAAKVQWKR